MQKIIANIHLGSIRRNAEYFKNKTGVKLCAVVKANAYGHGAEEVVFALADIADCFAVALADEGLALRTAALGKDILVFSPPISEEEAYEIVVNGFIATVADLWTAKLLCRVCEKYRLRARVHLKVNTGMNRYGMNGSMLGKVCTLLRDKPFVKVEGLYSHLYDTQEKNAREQRALFIKMQSICKRYFPSFISHLGATYGALQGEDFAFDMVRVGLGLYGYTPTGVEHKLPLQKGMTLQTQISCNRKFSFGGIGYGGKREEYEGRIAIVRGGYADGFLRNKANGALGCEKNLSNLCMDVCLRACGQRRGQRIPLLTDADAVAEQTGTIAYEALCAATRRAEFVYDYD